MPLQAPHLQTGDKVLIIATARKTNVTDIGVAKTLLEEQGFVVEPAPNLFGEYHQFSGTDEQRRADLQWALDHPEAKAIIVACGGYGTMRIIDLVNFEEFKKKPKWVAGYSDITVLLNHLWNLGFMSIHGTMPIKFGADAGATQSLIDLLKGEPVDYKITPHFMNKTGVCEAEVIGGNLSLLYALSGSSSEIKTDGKILFIEDLDEYLYHIDRMMMQLKRSGKLSNLAGLIVGGMSDMKDNSVAFGKSPEAIIADAVSSYSFPLCFNFPAGHVAKNMAFYHGARVRLEVNTQRVSLNYINVL